VPELDPARLAARQLELDRERTSRFPELGERKRERMRASPLAFLRGSAPLFYELLAERPELAAGPEGHGWIVGDAHLENFGAYRPRSRSTEDALGKKTPTFDLNDFDEAVEGPWRWDALRLTTSLLLAGQELGVGIPRALDLCDKLIESYVAAAFESAPLPRPPRPVVALLEQVGLRSKKQFLDARTTLEGDRRRFVRGPRYRDLAPDTQAQVPGAFLRYVSSLPDPELPSLAGLEIVDLALRVAGTGSLGVLRIAVLTRGKADRAAGAWIFDLKEQGQPSAAPLLPAAAPELAPALRVATACLSCVPEPPRMLGTTTLGALSLFGRRLLPQEDRLELTRLAASDLEPLSAYLGALLGRAHARGRKSPPAAPWSSADRAGLLERAVLLAGVHSATHQSYCLLTRPAR
jgi:uncharacterized protein (DUF2252 family)